MIAPPSPAAAVLVLLAPLLAACGGGTDLSYRWKEGEARAYRYVLEGKGARWSGEPVEFSTEMTTREATESELPGVSQNRVRIEGIRCALSLPGMPAGEALRFDTSDPKASEEAMRNPDYGPMVEVFKQMVGGEVYPRMQPSGHCSRLDGLDRLQERMFEGLPADSPLRGRFAAYSDEPNLRSQFEALLLVPAHPVAAGETWPYKRIGPLPQTLALPGFLYYVGTSRVAEVKDGVARVDMEGEVSLDPPEGAPRPARSQALDQTRAMLRLGKGTCRGFAKIRLEDGRLEDSELVTDLDLYWVKLGGAGEVPIGSHVVQRTTRIP